MTKIHLTYIPKISKIHFIGHSKKVLFFLKPVIMFSPHFRKLNSEEEERET